jgi:hypothetical protein
MCIFKGIESRYLQCKPMIWVTLSLFIIVGCNAPNSSNNSTEMSDTDNGTGVINSELDEPVNDGFIEGSCDSAVDEETSKDAVRIVYDFEKSVHEMVVCGGLTFTLIGALIDLIVELAVDPSSLKAPDAFRYDTETNSYITPPAGFGQTTMSIQFFETDENDEEILITHDLFKASNYLTGIRPEVNVRRRRLDIHYNETGPLVHLLGFGETPPNPIQLGINDASRLASEVIGLKFKMIIELSDERDYAETTYRVESPLTVINTALDSSILQTDLIEVSATREALSQSLDVTEWDLEYKDGRIGAMNGLVSFDVMSDPFQYQGVFTYENAGHPDIDLSCSE